MRTRSVSFGLFCFVLSALASAATIVPDTRVYLETLEPLVGKKDQVQVGQTVRCRVWKDVTVDGQVVIKAGTPAIAKVSSLKKRKVAGIKGKMEVAAIETSTVDGNAIQLTGGYNKEGKGRIALSASLAALVAWPLIFIPGKAAELPIGTVFDSYTMQTIEVAGIGKPDGAPMHTIDLSAMAGDSLSATVLYEKLEGVKKPKMFHFRIEAPATAPEAFFIATVNGESIDRIDMETVSVERSEEELVAIATVEIKPLFKHFKKGINTFEIGYDNGSEHVATEVILDIQI